MFLTHETVRGVRFRRWDAVALAGLWILLLQLPAARRWLPFLHSAEMRARWRRRLTAARGRPAGTRASDQTPQDAPPRHAPPSSAPPSS